MVSLEPRVKKLELWWPFQWKMSQVAGATAAEMLPMHEMLPSRNGSRRYLALFLLAPSSFFQWLPLAKPSQKPAATKLETREDEEWI